MKNDKFSAIMCGNAKPQGNAQLCEGNAQPCGNAWEADRLKIEIVHFDNGATPESMQAYIRVSGLTKDQLKNKGSTAFNVGKYIYIRYGLIFQPCPEYSRSRSEKNTLAFYVSKADFAQMPHLHGWILGIFNNVLNYSFKIKRPEFALYIERSFTIQSPKQRKKHEKHTK